jgi:hypothetical protein
MRRRDEPSPAVSSRPVSVLGRPPSRISGPGRRGDGSIEDAGASHRSGSPTTEYGAFHQPFNLALGACGLYCLFTGRFPFLERIGMIVTGRRLESGTNRLGFLNLILTTIVFIGMFVYMGWVGSQAPFH